MGTLQQQSWKSLQDGIYLAIISLSLIVTVSWCFVPGSAQIWYGGLACKQICKDYCKDSAGWCWRGGCFYQWYLWCCNILHGSRQPLKTSQLDYQWTVIKHPFFKIDINFNPTELLNFNKTHPATKGWRSNKSLISCLSFNTENNNGGSETLDLTEHWTLNWL